MAEKVQRIIGHGINCFINRQLIYNYPEEIFADAGVMAIGKITVTTVRLYISVPSVDLWHASCAGAEAWPWCIDGDRDFSSRAAQALS